MNIEDYINIKDLSERLDGDFALFLELVDLFLEDTNNHLIKIENAINKKDHEMLRKSSHTLKGSVSNFSAQKAYNAALELENIGRSKELVNAKSAFEALKIEINLASEALKIIKDFKKF